MLLLWWLSTCFVFVLLTEALDEVTQWRPQGPQEFAFMERRRARAHRRRVRSVQHYMFPRPRFPPPVDVPQCAQEARECGIMSLVSTEVD